MSGRWDKLGVSSPIDGLAARQTFEGETGPFLTENEEDFVLLDAEKATRMATHPNFVDLTGLRVGRLKILGMSADETRKNVSRKWVCECDCGRKGKHHRKAYLRGTIDRCESCKFNHYARHGKNPPVVEVSLPKVEAPTKYAAPVIKTQVVGWIKGHSKLKIPDNIAITPNYLQGRFLGGIKILGNAPLKGKETQHLALECMCGDRFAYERKLVVGGYVCCCSGCIKSKPDFTADRWKTELLGGLLLLRRLAMAESCKQSDRDLDLLKRAIKRLKPSETNAHTAPPNNNAFQAALEKALKEAGDKKGS